MPLSRAVRPASPAPMPMRAITSRLKRRQASGVAALAGTSLHADTMPQPMS